MSTHTSGGAIMGHYGVKVWTSGDTGASSSRSSSGGYWAGVRVGEVYVDDADADARER